jgi:hypothetical protein
VRLDGIEPPTLRFEVRAGDEPALSFSGDFRLTALPLEFSLAGLRD